MVATEKVCRSGDKQVQVPCQARGPRTDVDIAPQTHSACDVTDKSGEDPGFVPDPGCASGDGTARAEAPDGGWAWVIAASVCMANFLNNGHFKSFGLYIAPLMHLMNTTPSHVAWISSIWIGFSNCCGIVASTLTQMLGPRTVVIIGAVIVGSGLVCSSFVRSLPVLYVTFGMGCGVGMSFTFAPSLQMIGRYFLKRRGIANGICMGGNALGGIVLPVVIDALLKEYGFRGTILIMGGLMFNTTVCAMLWHPVEWHQRKRAPSCEGVTKHTSTNTSNMHPNEKAISDRNAASLVSLTTYKTVSNHEECDQTPNYLQKAEHHCVDPKNFTASPHDRSVTTTLPNVKYSEDRGSVNAGFDCDHFSDSKLSSDKRRAVSVENGPGTESKHGNGIPAAANGFVSTSKISDQRTKGKPPTNKLIDMTLMCQAMFWIITANQVCSLVAYPSTQLFLPLRALELGFTQSDGALLLSTLAIADLIGRLVVSWLSDFNLCSRGYWFSAGMTLSGVVASILPECHDLMTLTFAVATFGFCSGAHVGLFPSRISDVFGGHRVAMVVGLVNLCTCPFSFTGAPVMGYIMEKTNSYRVCQNVAGSLLIFGGLLCLLEPLVRRKDRRAYAVN